MHLQEFRGQIQRTIPELQALSNRLHHREPQPVFSVVTTAEERLKAQLTLRPPSPQLPAAINPDTLDPRSGRALPRPQFLELPAFAPRFRQPYRETVIIPEELHPDKETFVEDPRHTVPTETYRGINPFWATIPVYLRDLPHNGLLVIPNGHSYEIPRWYRRNLERPFGQGQSKRAKKRALQRMTCVVETLKKIKISPPASPKAEFE